MIARIRAWLGQSGPTPAAPADVLAARDTRIAQLEKQLSGERFITSRLSADVDRHEKANRVLQLQLATARDEVAQVRRDAQQADAAPCECGGDAELHLRGLIVRAEQQAARDRANANAMANQLASKEGRPVIEVAA